MIKHRRLFSIKSPVLAGLFLLSLLSACQNPKTADEVTLVFWQAMANNELTSAKQYATADSQSLLKPLEKKLKQAQFSAGEIVINGSQAHVETQARLPSDETSSFTTFLIKEDNLWRVDYHRTHSLLSDNLVNDLFKSLKNIGDNLNKQLEQQMPLIEKELESFGQELKNQLDKLGQDLEKALPLPLKEQEPNQNSI